MPAKQATDDVQRFAAASNLEEALSAQLSVALKNNDHIVSLSTIDTLATSTKPYEFVNAATRLANEHKATSLEFYQLDHNTHGGDVCHIAVLKFPRVTVVKS